MGGGDGGVGGGRGRAMGGERVGVDGESKPSDRAARGALLRLAAPLVVSFWMRSLFTFVDTIYASRLGDAAVAATGLAVPLEFTFIAVWIGISNGLTAALGEAFGARDQSRIEALLGACRRMTAFLVPAFLGLGIGAWRWAPRLGLDFEVAHQFGIYAGVIVAGTAMTGFWSIVPDSLVKAHHDTRSTMVAGIISNLVNLALNTLFLFVFHWGIFGIALSTVLGRLGGLSYASHRASGLERARKERWARETKSGPVPTYGRTPAVAILALALPASVSFGLMAAEAGIINRLLAFQEAATSAIAAYAIYHRMVIFVIMPVVAISAAALPYYARAWGRRDLAVISRGMQEASAAGVIYMGLVAAPLLWRLAAPISSFLVQTPEAYDATVFALRLTPLAGLATIPFLLCRPVFDGMQRGAPGAMMSFLRYGLLTLPLSYGGMICAPLLGFEPFRGVILGVITAGMISSMGFLLWTTGALRAARRLEV